MMRAIKTLMLLLICSPAVAEEQMATFGDWKVLVPVFSSSKSCYAYTTPFRTKALEGSRDNPYMIITYRGPHMYSLGINAGFPLSGFKGFTLFANNRTHLLDVKIVTNAWTYSSAQDVAIIDDLIRERDFAEVRSYDQKDKTALDYYSVRGLTTVLQYFDKNC
ncbi:MAG: hypothetical protein ACHP6I_01345 [Rickettsiales bacterium]